jgi:hypothetical protein
MTARARIFSWLAGAVLAALALIPIPYLASPRWEVWVVDNAGTPIEGMTVRRVYQDYSIESEGHEEDRITNGQGYTFFPAATSSSSIAQRCIFTVLSARAGVHASFGRHASVFAFGNGRQGAAVSGPYVTDWTGGPAYMKSRITATLLRDPSQSQ